MATWPKAGIYKLHGHWRGYKVAYFEMKVCFKGLTVLPIAANSNLTCLMAFCNGLTLFNWLLLWFDRCAGLENHLLRRFANALELKNCEPFWTLVRDITWVVGFVYNRLHLERCRATDQFAYSEVFFCVHQVQQPVLRCLAVMCYKNPVVAAEVAKGEPFLHSVCSFHQCRQQLQRYLYVSPPIGHAVRV